MEAICFVASLPDIGGAIRISGAGNGARIQLDIPQSDIAEAVRMTMVQGQLLRVTVEVDNGSEEKHFSSKAG